MKPLRICVAYAVVSVLWMYASEALIALVAQDAEQFRQLSLYRGWLFVAVTGTLLYELLVRRRSGEALVAIGSPLPADSRLRSAAGAALIALAITGTGFTLFAHQKDRIKREKNEELTAVADLKAREIGRWLARQQDFGEAVGRDASLVGAVASWLAGAGEVHPADIRARLESLQRMQRYREVVLLDANAVPRLSAPAVSSPEFDRAMALRAMQTRNVVFSDIQCRPAQSDLSSPCQPQLTVFVPLLRADGKAIAIVALVHDPQHYLYPLVRSWPTAGATAETLLVHREGDQLAFLSELRHYRGAPLSLRRPLSELSVEVKAVLGEQGVIEGADYRGVGVLAAARPIPGTDWVMTAKVDEDEVMAPVRVLALTTTLLILALLAGVFAAVWMWWRQKQAEAALARHALVEENLQREQRLRSQVETAKNELEAVLGSINDAFLTLDRDWHYTYANDRACAMLGISREHLAGRTLWEVFPRESGGRLAGEVQRAMRTGEPAHFEQQVPSGGRWLEYRIYPSETGLTVLATDISERKRAEEALRESEQRFRTALRATRIVVFSQDRDLHYTWVHNAEREGSAHTLLVDGEGEGDGPLPLHLREFNQIKREVIDSGLGVRREVESNGRCYDLTVEPLLDRDGRVSGITGAAADITERRQVEQALRESEERFRAMAETVPAFLFTLRPTGECDFVNRHFIEYTGLVFSSALGRGWLQAVHPEDLPRVAGTGTAAQRRGEAYSFECRLRAADGSYRWFLANNRPVSDAEGGLAKWFGAWIDIHDLKHTEGELRLAANALANTAEGVVISAAGRIVSVNKAFSAITGYTPDEVIGQPVALLHSSEHEPVQRLARREGVQRNGSWQGEIWARRKDGAIYPAWSSISAVPDDRGGTTLYVSVFSDISTAKQYEERLEYLAHHDVLTGLANRTLFHERLRDMLVRAQRYRHVVAVLYIDLDRFKPINDSLGHEVGDRLLKLVAERLKGSVRASDTVGRLGGDEFAILLDELGNVEEAALIAQNLLDTLARPFNVTDHELYVSASIGVSCFPQDGEALDALVRNADAAMYRAKEDGRNAYRFFRSEMNEQAAEKVFLTNSLRQAIERRQLALAYQPRICLESGAVMGIEALVRWQHPERGVILPARFISLAEESGMIEPLGEWVLETAARQMREWKSAGIAPPRISVNLSARQFAHGELCAKLLSILERCGLQAEQLELEIAESTLMQNPEQAERVLGELSNARIAVTIDDFGTGYSSLSHLKRFPVSSLKIDHSFIAGVPAHGGDAAVARAVIAMGRSLNLMVIAEGVENEAQSYFLQQHGCDAAQGYLFSRPLDAIGAQAYLRSHQRATDTLAHFLTPGH